MIEDNGVMLLDPSGEHTETVTTCPVLVAGGRVLRVRLKHDVDCAVIESVRARWPEAVITLVPSADGRPTDGA